MLPNIKLYVCLSKDIREALAEKIFPHANTHTHTHAHDRLRMRHFISVPDCRGGGHLTSE